MAANPSLPRAQSSLIDTNGYSTREWYTFFQQLLQFVGENSGDAAAITAILVRLDALEDDAGGPFIHGLNSVFVNQGEDIVQIQLVNDVGAPGNTYYYGTGPTGLKGWFTVRSAIDNGDGIDLVAGGDGVTEISFNADTGLIAALPGATYDTVQKFVDVMHSPGIITGGELSDIGSGNVRVSAGTMMIRIADDDVAQMPFANFAQTDFAVPNDQTTRFFGVVYNAGSPIVEMRSSFNWNKDTEIPLGSAVRLSASITIVTANKYRTGDPITNVIQRADAVSPAIRDASEGGLLLGVAGTRNVTLSAGRIWSRLSDFAVSSKNSSTSPMLTAFFNGTNLTVTSGVTQWDNANFNDMGSGTLVALANNKYANLWFFISIDGTQYGFAYGTAEYNTLGEAANENIPAYLTQNFFNQTLLLGRFLFQEGAATPSQIESAFTQLFTTQALNNHNDLAGLQGGTTAEFYHFTQEQHQTLAPLGSTAWALDSLPIGTGADTVAQVAFGANTFPAKAASGNLVAKTITTDSLSALAGTDGTGNFLRGDGTLTNTVIGSWNVRSGATTGAMVLGADVSATTISDNVRKLFRATIPNFDNATTSNAFIFGADQQGTATDDIVYIGGWQGASGMVAACRVIFATAAAPGTVGGTNRWMIENNGFFLPVQTNAVSIGSDALRVLRTTTRELSVGGQNASFGGGAGLMFMSNAITVPTSNPTAGGILYSEAGAGKWRGSGGTITTFGPANPHCPQCGRDTVHEAFNDAEGWYIARCWSCAAKGINSFTEVRGAWDREE